MCVAVAAHMAAATRYKASPLMPMPDELRALVSAVVTRAPQWLRQDLLSTDAAGRARAEDALAAMIEQAIRDAAGDIEQR